MSLPFSTSVVFLVKWGRVPSFTGGEREQDTNEALEGLQEFSLNEQKWYRSYQFLGRPVLL